MKTVAKCQPGSFVAIDRRTRARDAARGPRGGRQMGGCDAGS